MSRVDSCGCKDPRWVECARCGVSYLCRHIRCPGCGSYHTMKDYWLGFPQAHCLDCGKEWAVL